MDLSVYYEDQGYLFEMKISELEKQLAERDKLIEQMREALKIVKAHMHKTGDFYAIDDVNAALSAAERDEL